MIKLFGMDRQTEASKPSDPGMDTATRNADDSISSSSEGKTFENVLPEKTESRKSPDSGIQTQPLDSVPVKESASRYTGEDDNPLLVDLLGLPEKKIHQLEVAFAILFILLFTVAIWKIGDSVTVSDPVIDNGEISQNMSETRAPGTEAPQETADPILQSENPQSEVSESEQLEKRREELIREGADSVRVLLFDEEDGQSGISPYLTITGLTDKEKRDAGFVESDFLSAAGLFLKERGISTKRIIVENAIECSAPDGMAFQARLEKQDGYTFQFILFRSLPGEYIFTLQKLDTEVESETLTAETSAAQTDGQNVNQTGVQEQSQTAISSQSQASAANDYDATTLTISSVPEELLNYLDNEYVFQYSLYDYLYQNGKKDIRDAEVTGYTIDSVERRAMIQIRLSDGTTLNGTYSKKSGSYSFS